MKILLGSQSYQGQSAGVSGQRLLNLYAKMNPEGSKYPFSLIRTPGLKPWGDLATNVPVDGMQVMGNSLYAISGNQVFSVSTAAVATNIGALTGTVGMVDLANNGTQMAVVTPDQEGFVITSAAVAQITDVDFPAVTSVAFLDQYHIFSEADSGRFIISALSDATDYDALDFATAEERPDNLKRVTDFNGALWPFGDVSFEVYSNTGNADFPFEQIPGAVNTSRGLASKFAVAQDDNSLFFLGNDRIVYRIEGYRPVIISTDAVSEAIDEYDTIDDAFCFIYTLAGHKFLVLTFPTERKTWVFDIASNKWHERSSMNLGRWRPNCFVNFAGKNLVGDSVTGKIYELDLGTFDEDGTQIQRIAEGTVVWNDDRRITHDRVYLDMKAGVGLITGQGSDPQVAMTYSDDGGRTFSNERWRSFGAIGKFKTRPVWRKNGQSRERIYHFETSEPVEVQIDGAYLEARVGSV